VRPVAGCRSSAPHRHRPAKRFAGRSSRFCGAVLVATAAVPVIASSSSSACARGEWNVADRRRCAAIQTGQIDSRRGADGSCVRATRPGRSEIAGAPGRGKPFGVNFLAPRN
jgi:hypothetical protein